MNVNLSREVLESAPQRTDWQGPTVYDSLYLVPSEEKHDSGWMLIRIVGQKADGSLETAACCDDINWTHKPNPRGTMRSDMTFPGGVLHCWGNGLLFTVGAALSSTDVEVGPK